MYVKLSDLNNDYKEQLFHDNKKITTNILDVEKIKIQSDYKELYYNIKLILIIVILAIFAISLIIAKTKGDNNADILKFQIIDDKIDIS